MINIIIGIMAMATLVFGGGQVFIPLLEDMYVTTGLVESEVFYEIVGLANGFPGPFSGKIYTYFTLVEYGWWNAFWVNILFAIPALVFVTYAMKYFDKLKTFKPFTNLTIYIRASVVAILVYVGFTLSKGYTGIKGLDNIDYKTFSISALMITLNLFLFKYLKKARVLCVVLSMAVALVVL